MKKYFSILLALCLVLTILAVSSKMICLMESHVN